MSLQRLSLIASAAVGIDFAMRDDAGAIFIPHCSGLADLHILDVTRHYVFTDGAKSDKMNNVDDLHRI
jgi:hypothetical protein